MMKVVVRKIKNSCWLWAGFLSMAMMSNVALADGFGVSNNANNQASGNDQAIMAKLLKQEKMRYQHPQSVGSQSVGSQSVGPQSARPQSNVGQNSLGQSTTGVQSAPQVPAKESIGDEAFASTARTMVPLTPEQIKTLHYLFDQSQKAAAASPGTPPKPTSTSLIVNMSPGSAPPLIRLSQGFVSSLVFVDATGAPWPIKAFDLGNPKAFNIHWDQKGNTLMVQALQRYKTGNLAVILKGMDTPIMVSLMPGQRAVDYRVDMRVPRLGPNANPMLEGLPSKGDPNLMNVLDGVPPEGAKALKILGDGSCQAWLLNDHIFLRTSMAVMTPAWISTMSSPDGTHAYEIQKAPVILAMRHGKIVKLTIEGL